MLLYGVLIVTVLVGVLIVLVVGWPTVDAPVDLQGGHKVEKISQTTVYDSQSQDNVIPFPLHRRRKNKS